MAIQHIKEAASFSEAASFCSGKLVVNELSYTLIIG